MAKDLNAKEYEKVLEKAEIIDNLVGANKSHVTVLKPNAVVVSETVAKAAPIHITPISITSILNPDYVNKLDKGDAVDTILGHSPATATPYEKMTDEANKKDLNK